MADAVCGPSNALQNFQKHTSVDRTLQQDRLISRSGPSQNFRSNRTGADGVLDPEFHSFQAGIQQPPSFLDPRVQPLPHAPFHQQPPPSFQQQPLSRPPQQVQPAWASDFQRLTISGPSRQPSSASLRSQQKTNWFEDFQRQQASTSFQTSQPSFASHMNYGPPMNTYQPYSNIPHFEGSQIQDKGKGKAVENDQFDESAFEKEFEAHASQLLQMDQPSVEQEQTVQADASQFSTTAGSLAPAPAKAQQKHTIRPDYIGPESIIAREDGAQREEEKAQGPISTDEDLAAAAGELLERVSDNTSEKFRKSNFLALMGKLRDREVRVDGDQIVATDVS